GSRRRALPTLPGQRRGADPAAAGPGRHYREAGRVGEPPVHLVGRAAVGPVRVRGARPERGQHRRPLPRRRRHRDLSRDRDLSVPAAAAGRLRLATTRRPVAYDRAEIVRLGDGIRSGSGEGQPVGAERDRVAEFGKLEDGLRQASDWYRWGPYLSEQQWGTVREDYSPDGQAWDYLPHDHARSRAYRWGEDGLAGFCDVEQRLCLGLALWHGKGPILKERASGLTGAQGNHGEDVKEYWWYLDALPSHAWNRWRYHYPQGAFPYQDLIDQNGSRTRTEPEYELLDTGAFDQDRYWITEVHYVKASPDDLLMTVQVTNAGPETATLHVLPTAWFRNTWSWDVGAPKPKISAVGDSEVGIEHPFVGPMELLAVPGPAGTGPTVLFCENKTNDQRMFGSAPRTPYPKDGIND